jgi:hypothetical protein
MNTGPVQKGASTQCLASSCVEPTYETKEETGKSLLMCFVMFLLNVRQVG